MSKKLKIGIITLIILIGIPAIVFGSSFTNSLIQGKTPKEAIKIIANQLDSLIGRTIVMEEKQSDLENSQNETDLTIDQIIKENSELKAQILEQKNRVDTQEQQRQNDIRCAELYGIGSKYFPTKQPLKELYEAMVRQNSVTFEEAYEEHRNNGAKVLPEPEFRIQWQTGKNSRDEKTILIKPYYEEYMSKCI